MTGAVPPRIYCLAATEAPVAAVFRRGPTAWSHVGRWDLAEGRYEPGAWLRGRHLGTRRGLRGRVQTPLAHGPGGLPDVRHVDARLLLHRGSPVRTASDPGRSIRQRAPARLAGGARFAGARRARRLGRAPQRPHAEATAGRRAPFVRGEPGMGGRRVRRRAGGGRHARGLLARVCRRPPAVGRRPMGGLGSARATADRHARREAPGARCTRRRRRPDDPLTVRRSQAIARNPFCWTTVSRRKAGPPGLFTPRSQSETRFLDTFRYRAKTG